jgi:hypothetical protein
MNSAGFTKRKENKNETHNQNRQILPMHRRPQIEIALRENSQQIGTPFETVIGRPNDGAKKPIDMRIVRGRKCIVGNASFMGGKFAPGKSTNAGKCDAGMLNVPSADSQ